MFLRIRTMSLSIRRIESVILDIINVSYKNCVIVKSYRFTCDGHPVVF